MASAAVDTPMATEEERAVKQFYVEAHTQTEDHWIPIATIASFKRMREFERTSPPPINSFRSFIPPKERMAPLCSALFSSLLEIDETGTKARRAHELVEPKDQFERSVYAKGFPDETPDLQVRLEKFFSQFGKVNAVRMRRTEQKVFKNSVFVEFDDFSSVKAFLEADPKPTFEGAELVTMSKEAYCTMKIKEKGLDKKGVTARTHSGTGGAGGRKQFDAFQNLNGGKKEKEAVTVKFQGKVYTLDGEGKINVPVEEFEFEKGSAIKFTGAGSEDAKFGEIKSPLKEKFTPLPFIKMDKGATEGVFGFGKTLSEEEIAFLKKKSQRLEVERSLGNFFPVRGRRTHIPLLASPRPSQACHADAQQKGNQKGGRGGNRDKGGRPNNNRGRNDRDSKPRSRGADSKPRSKAEDATAKDEPVEALKAGKTRGEVEPSGESAGQGIRGASIPSVASTGAKRKAEGEGESPEKKAKVEE
ncbi:the RNA-binding Lupus La protein [Rhizoctonia solani]|uniref:The RNA-binding Lupus La protein n=1 Tax=Rhizoctonia solani TaxID=456999 RepID=A0A8H7ILL4_9AGAM|nr:the RNA-binding Lupus La protein [Rhizoctonia solani]